MDAGASRRPVPGECNLALAQGTPAAVVKSVFETAAFAGYPFTGFVVQKDGGGLGVLATDAQVPGPALALGAKPEPRAAPTTLRALRQGPG